MCVYVYVHKHICCFLTLGEKEVDDETAEFLEETDVFNRKLVVPGMSEDAQECFFKKIDDDSAPKMRKQATSVPSTSNTQGGDVIVQLEAADPEDVAAELMPSMQREANEARSFASAILVHPEANNTPENLCRFATFMDKMYKKIQDRYFLLFLFCLLLFSFFFLF